jgi:Holliday junction resolvase RusA-like endonuclease
MCKCHWNKYSKVKAYWKEMVHLQTINKPKFKTADVKVTLTFPDKRRRDKDNYYSSLKFILDGLECIEDDNSDIIRNISLEFAYQKGISKTEVVILGVK